MASSRRLHHPAPERHSTAAASPIEATGDNFTDPNFNINRNNNYLNLDSTYVFKVDSTYELPWKIGTSVNFQHYTGFPIQPTATFNVPDGLGVPRGETVILQPAGTQRLPSVNQLNLRLSREFVFNERWRLIPSVDFFNLTNSQTVISEVTQFTIGAPNGGSYLKPSLRHQPLRDALRSPLYVLDRGPRLH